MQALIFHGSHSKEIQMNAFPVSIVATLISDVAKKHRPNTAFGRDSQQAALVGSLRASHSGCSSLRR